MSPESKSPAEDWKLPWEGGCRCDRVRLRVTAPPLFTAACHCPGCQRMSSSAFSLTVAVPTAGFAVTKGETVIGGLHGAIRHHFCAYCMTWVFTQPEGVTEFINLRPSMLDEHRWFVPFIETYTEEKLPWVSTPAKYSYAKFPEMTEFAPILADFAATGARPSSQEKR